MVNSIFFLELEWILYECDIVYLMQIFIYTILFFFNIHIYKALKKSCLITNSFYLKETCQLQSKDNFRLKKYEIKDFIFKKKFEHHCFTNP